MEVKVDFKDGSGEQQANLILDRTDAEIVVRFFLNPYWWLRFKVLHQPGFEYGIIIGPLSVAIFLFKVFKIELKHEEDRPN